MTSTAPIFVPNPEFLLWVQQDQLILSTLISSLSETLIAQVVGYSTSREMWLGLERLFASHSRARILQLHFQLATLKKAGSSIADYFQKFKYLSDNLATTGQPLNDFEQHSFPLAGLGTNFDSIVASLSTKSKPMSIEDLYSHLLIHEQRLEHHNSTVPEPVFPSMNIATRGSPQ